MSVVRSSRVCANPWRHERLARRRRMRHGRLTRCVHRHPRSKGAAVVRDADAPRGLRGEWEAAHELAQAQDDAEGAWVHAWVHRIEGDLGNADYWYRHANRRSRRDDTRAEGLDIARALIHSMPS